MSIEKEQLIKNTAEQLGQPEDVVGRVVSWSFKDANKALKLYSEVEISGWGKFILSQAKLRKRIERMEKSLITLENSDDVQTNEEKIEGMRKSLEYFYSKLKTNENNGQDIQGHMGGLPQSSGAPPTSESSDRAGGRGEATNMPQLS